MIILSPRSLRTIPTSTREQVVQDDLIKPVFRAKTGIGIITNFSSNRIEERDRLYFPFHISPRRIESFVTRRKFLVRI